MTKYIKFIKYVKKRDRTKKTSRKVYKFFYECIKRKSNNNKKVFIISFD